MVDDGGYGRLNNGDALVIRDLRVQRDYFQRLNDNQAAIIRQMNQDIAALGKDLADARLVRDSTIQANRVLVAQREAALDDLKRLKDALKVLQAA